MNIEQFRKAGYQAIDRICDYYYALQESKFPVLPDVEPGYLRPLLPSSAPESGEDFSQIAEDYQKLIVKGYTHWQHPSFLAYFPAGFSFEGILGDLYASSVSNPGFNWLSSPSCTELESIVLDWASKMLGLSSSFLNASGVGGGCFQNTASEAALVAIIAARTAYKAAHPDTKLEDMRIYTSTQTHSLGLKAGVILGLTVRALEVTREDNFSLRGYTLRSALEEDKKKGLHPFILIATIGTTSSGAVDNIAEIRTVAKVTDFPDIKIHVDAAWAGMALVCPEFREMCYLKDINAIADSFSTNFHKAVDLNKVFVELVSSSDMLSLCAPPSLALSVFRVNPKPSTLNQATLPEDALNDLNKLFYGRISVRKDIFLTQTVLNGQFCIRLAIGSAFTQDVHIREAFEVITYEGKLTLEAWDRLLPRGP
ncbi:hypothetical protein HHX47_DHR3000279 [Lentinula edodes]|nr:hypothetical protein HHX47_DHR3000279 [Lentinula edodes]